MNADEKNKYLFHCVDMHGIMINCSSMNQALEEVEELVVKRSKRFVCFFEANLFHHTLCDKEVRDVINEAALIYPDGIAPVLGASLCSRNKFQRVSGPSFFLEICKYGVSKNWHHFLLGGGDGIAEKLADRLKKEYPGIHISGTYCPPFRTLTNEEFTDVRRQIEESHTDLLWVALGGPKQERWMKQYQGMIDVPVMLGVGAAFDFHTGNRPWAPKIVRTLGLEWLWRMFSGGYKTFTRNVKCVSHILLVLIKDVIKFKIFRKTKKDLVFRNPFNNQN